MYFSWSTEMLLGTPQACSSIPFFIIFWAAVRAASWAFWSCMNFSRTPGGRAFTAAGSTVVSAPVWEPSNRRAAAKAGSVSAMVLRATWTKEA